MRRLGCQNCGNEVFFDSTRCMSCGRVLAYAPGPRAMLAGPDGGPWRLGERSHAACANREAVWCNFVAEPGEALCAACRHNRVIPDLSDARNVALWAKIEAAKRMLFHSILAWDLPRPTKREEPSAGLAFDFLADEPQPDGTVKAHLTGHAGGVITINIAEGDDAERERRRALMGEPYRTLVGHFRHEIGHYYFDRLVAPRPDLLAACRALFGDEREDYAAALARHYENGPRAGWAEAHISAYASAHPFEDFAETFAHYIHMVDGLETAAAFGVRTATASPVEAPYAHGDLAELVAAWVPVTVALNAVNRSMGQPDLYPFVLSAPVHEKLAFVHGLVRGGRG